MSDHYVWSNWSGAQSCRPQQIIVPDSLEALCYAVRDARQCRVAGAGHSFSPLVNCDDTLLSLDDLSGVLAVDQAQVQATCLAGTRLHDLTALLAEYDQALINQGDIDQQSLAGAVATGTHGTGADLSCIAGSVCGFKLVTAQGDILNCTPDEHPDIFAAGRVSLGLLGVLYSITLQNLPRYKLEENVWLERTSQLLPRLDDMKARHRHVEIMPFIHADAALVKTLDMSDEPVQNRAGDSGRSDRILRICAELVRWYSPLNAWLQHKLTGFVDHQKRVDFSHRIFPSQRNTRFNEMEYQLPVEQGLACLQEVLAHLKKRNVPVFFPLEFRYVKGDDILLSPFYARDSVSISVHQYYKQPFRELFIELEPIFQKYQGRPHWGKWHNLSAAELVQLYPQWNQFKALRAELDPENKFVTPYLAQLFGLDTD